MADLQSGTTIGGNVAYHTGNLPSSSGLGEGQTWQAAELTNTGATFLDGTPKFRQANVTYTNTTGRTIAVMIQSGVEGVSYFYIDGVSMGDRNDNGSRGFVTFLVPDGSTYSASRTPYVDGSRWVELR